MEKDNKLDYRKLEKDMYDTSNEIIGNVGPKIDKEFIDSRREELTSFSLHREVLDYSEIMDAWTKWITAYCTFKKLHRYEGCTLIDNPDLIVRWMREPSVNIDGIAGEVIEKYPDEHNIWDCHYGGKPDVENPNYFRVRAFLAVFRIDHNPTTGK